MSEPTYRVDLTHNPADGLAVCWTARVYYVSEGEGAGIAMSFYGPTREDAFDKAQAWTRAKAQEPEQASTVFLTEAGDILDPHEVQR